jgi:hypothetical protein
MARTQSPEREALQKRKEQRADESAAAMQEYLTRQQHTLDRMKELRAQRVARDQR